MLASLGSSWTSAKGFGGGRVFGEFSFAILDLSRVRLVARHNEEGG